MSSQSITLEPVDGSTVDRVRTLLAANDLPTADVRADGDRFFLALADSTVVGAGGLVLADSNGFLRSLVVRDRHRGAGYGTAICDALEARALDSGVTRLYLLTTTATPFFRDRGYAVADRADVPAQIRRSRQFTDLCPESATCMRKRLE